MPRDRHVVSVFAGTTSHADTSVGVSSGPVLSRGCSVAVALVADWRITRGCPRCCHVSRLLMYGPHMTTDNPRRWSIDWRKYRPDEVVDLGGGHLVPLTVTVHIWGTHVVLTLTMRDGEYRVTSITGPDLTRAVLNELRISTITRFAAALPLRVESQGLYYADGNYESPPAVGRGNRITEDALRTAADAYLAAKADRLPVKQAVAEALTCSAPQASVYIRRAREAGLIPPLSSKGRPRG